MSTVEKRQLEFGDKLRQLRDGAGLTGRGLAKVAGWDGAKVSRIENGKQLPTDSDVIKWVEVTHSPESVAAQLRDELREIRIQLGSWKRQLRSGHRGGQEDAKTRENAAANISVFELSVVPGFVQTADYARAVFDACARFNETPADADDAVRVRMERQTVLYDSSKTIELLMTESALRYPVCTPEVMAAQLDRLLALAGLASVRFGIIALNTRMPVPPMSGFCITADKVFVETDSTEITIEDPDEVTLYNRLNDLLWSVAATGADARSILRAVASDIEP